MSADQASRPKRHARAVVQEGLRALRSTSKVDGVFHLIWLLAIGGCLGALLTGRSLTSQPGLVLLGIALACTAVSRWHAARRLVVTVLTTLAVPLYLFEGYLRVFTAESKAAAVARLRAQGSQAYPAVFPTGFIKLWRQAGIDSPIEVEGQAILPLAGVPDVPTVFCENPAGMLIYQSDRFGFRDSGGQGQVDEPDYLLLGDSFVQGYCVGEADTYAAQLSPLGTVANLGVNGTSVLAQAAIHAEYGEALRPKHVLWFFYEGNDPAGYHDERTAPILRNYLESGFTQRLWARPEAVGSATRHYVDAELGSRAVLTIAHDQDALDADRSWLQSARGFVTLHRTRRALRRACPLVICEFPSPDLSAEDWAEIEALWRRVVERERARGVPVTFVYVPLHFRFGRIDPIPFAALERRVLGIWSHLGADYVSLTPFLEGVESPLSLFSDIHFNAQGYGQSAAYIAAHLRKPE